MVQLMCTLSSFSYLPTLPNNPYFPFRLKEQLLPAAKTPRWLSQIPNQLKTALPGWIFGDLC